MARVLLSNGSVNKSQQQRDCFLWGPRRDRCYAMVRQICFNNGRQCFSWGPCKGVILKNKWRHSSVLTRVEAGSNTSTVTLRVVGGDEKGSLKCETEKIWSRDPRGSDQRKVALASASSIYKSQTRPLVREGAPQEKETVIVIQLIKIWS
jgi:hypothetical protein